MDIRKDKKEEIELKFICLSSNWSKYIVDLNYLVLFV